jgi:PAS domain S-box-containing protein
MLANLFPPMSWVTIVWSMVASACLTLALMHLLIWLNRRQAWSSLWFFLSATGTCFLALDELWMMRSQTIVQYTSAIRWLHPPAFLVIVALVGFVRVYLRAGRPWLGWAVCGVRTLSLVLNFILTPNLNYRRITGLHQIPFLGDSVSVGEGVPSPWMLVGQLSLLLLVIFVVDAAASVWRRGDRQHALVVGGSIVFFSIAGSVYAVLALWKIVDGPITASLFYMGIILSMAYELSYDSARAVQLGQDLQESEHRLELAAEAAQIGVWIRDLASNKIWATDRWRSLFGFSPSEPLDFNLMMQRLHPNDRDDLSYVIGKALEESGTYEKEYRVVLPSGQVRWIASRGQAQLNDRGKPVRVLGLSMDVTQRKVTELEAQQQRWELAHLSRVTMLGELSGSIAHELNQPLTAILSNAQAAQRFLAQDNIDIEEVNDILTDIVEQDQRAGEVIRRLRLLLKEGEVQQLPLDVNDVLQEGLKLIRNDLVSKGVTIVAGLKPSLPAVIGDRVQLQQVLLNLVMNACDAMMENAPTDRRVEVSTELSNGQGVLCSVSDLGSGIPAEKLEQVFEPFFTTKSHGLGLGLSVCRSIINAHGGRLWASNNPVRGTTFHFTLPVGDESRVASGE